MTARAMLLSPMQAAVSGSSAALQVDVVLSRSSGRKNPFVMTLRWLSAGLGLPIAGLLILGAVTTAAQQTPPQPHQTPPSQQQAAKPANIDRNGVLMLIRSTLLALDHANKTGNYTVLHPPQIAPAGVCGCGSARRCWRPTGRTRRGTTPGGAPSAPPASRPPPPQSLRRSLPSSVATSSISPALP